MASSHEMEQAEIPARGIELSPSRIAFPKGGSRILNSLRLALADGTFFFAITTFAVWLLSRPFEGIDGDSRIYIARALADIDPGGVGRDFMFVYDGQSQFSIFHLLAARLVAAFNPAIASLILSIANAVCWFGAALFFISRFLQGRMKWAILMIVAIVPSYYGPFNLLRFGEQYPIPRPLAEACVLVALAFLLDGRRSFAALFLLFAAAFHPIMALPGVLIFGIDLCRSDRRWLIAGLCLSLAGLGAVFLGLPLFNRLTSIDPDWLSLLRIRNPYLFPTAWPLDTFAFLALALATIILAGNLVSPKAKFIFWSAAAAGLAGLGVATIFGDLWPSLLIVQAQLWRMIWLSGVIATISFALCLLHLRERGARIELAVAFLAFGWLFWDTPALVCFASFGALLLFSMKQVSFTLSTPILNTIWGLILVCGSIAKIELTFAFFGFATTAPAGDHAPFYLLWDIYLFSILLGIFAWVWVFRAHWLSPRILGAIAAVAAVCVVCFWDDRSAGRKLADAASHPADLAALIPADHSEIYWSGAVEPWYLLGHPSWLLRIQGAGIVFSRPLSMFWLDRVKALIAMKLADESILKPWAVPGTDDSVALTRASVDQLCARPDAPSTIVTALEDGGHAPSDIKFKTWVPPVPQARLVVQDDALAWRKIEKFIVISCVDHVPEPQAQAN